MSIPEQFTTDKNKMPAPVWESPGLYWNPDYLAYCERRDRGNHQRVQHGAVRVEQTPVSNTIVPGKGKYTPVRATRRCPICDEEFAPVVSAQKVCASAACRQERDRRRARKAYVARPLEPRVCIQCGKTYQPIKGVQQTCSATCRDAWNKRQKGAA